METSILDKYNAGLIPSKTNATTAAIRQVNAQHSPLTKIKTGYDRELEQTPIDDYEEMYLLDKENPEETLKDKSYLKDAWTTFMNSRDQINLMSERAKLAKDINPVLDDIDYELNFLSDKQKLKNLENTIPTLDENSEEYKNAISEYFQLQRTLADRQEQYDSILSKYGEKEGDNIDARIEYLSNSRKSWEEERSKVNEEINNIYSNLRDRSENYTPSSEFRIKEQRAQDKPWYSPDYFLYAGPGLTGSSMATVNGYIADALATGALWLGRHYATTGALNAVPGIGAASNLIGWGSAIAATAASVAGNIYSRHRESLAQVYGAYRSRIEDSLKEQGIDIKQYAEIGRNQLKQQDPNIDVSKISDDEIIDRVISGEININDATLANAKRSLKDGLERVYDNNMALSAMDVAQSALVFAPLGKAMGKIITAPIKTALNPLLKTGTKLSEAAASKYNKLIDAYTGFNARLAYNSPVKNASLQAAKALGRLGFSATGEAFEEANQDVFDYDYISGKYDGKSSSIFQSLMGLADANYRTAKILSGIDTESELANDPQFWNDVKGGFALGLYMGGPTIAYHSGLKTYKDMTANSFVRDVVADHIGKKDAMIKAISYSEMANKKLNYQQNVLDVLENYKYNLPEGITEQDLNDEIATANNIFSLSKSKVNQNIGKTIGYNPGTTEYNTLIGLQHLATIDAQEALDNANQAQEADNAFYTTLENDQMLNHYSPEEKLTAVALTKLNIQKQALEQLKTALESKPEENQQKFGITNESNAVGKSISKEIPNILKDIDAKLNQLSEGTRFSSNFIATPNLVNKGIDSYVNTMIANHDLLVAEHKMNEIFGNTLEDGKLINFNNASNESKKNIGKKIKERIDNYINNSDEASKIVEENAKDVVEAESAKEMSREAANQSDDQQPITNNETQVDNQVATEVEQEKATSPKTPIMDDRATSDIDTKIPVVEKEIKEDEEFPTKGLEELSKEFEETLAKVKEKKQEDTERKPKPEPKPVVETQEDEEDEIEFERADEKALIDLANSEAVSDEDDKKVSETYETSNPEVTEESQVKWARKKIATESKMNRRADMDSETRDLDESLEIEEMVQDKVSHTLFFNPDATTPIYPGAKPGKELAERIKDPNFFNDSFCEFVINKDYTEKGHKPYKENDPSTYDSASIIMLIHHGTGDYAMALKTPSGARTFLAAKLASIPKERLTEEDINLINNANDLSIADLRRFRNAVISTIESATNDEAVVPSTIVRTKGIPNVVRKDGRAVFRPIHEVKGLQIPTEITEITPENVTFGISDGIVKDSDIIGANGEMLPGKGGSGQLFIYPPKSSTLSNQMLPLQLTLQRFDRNQAEFLAELLINYGTNPNSEYRDTGVIAGELIDFMVRFGDATKVTTADKTFDWLKEKQLYIDDKSNLIVGEKTFNIGNLSTQDKKDIVEALMGFHWRVARKNFFSPIKEALPSVYDYFNNNSVDLLDIIPGISLTKDDFISSTPVYTMGVLEKAGIIRSDLDDQLFKDSFAYAEDVQKIPRKINNPEVKEAVENKASSLPNIPSTPEPQTEVTEDVTTSEVTTQDDSYIKEITNDGEIDPLSLGIDEDFDVPFRKVAGNISEVVTPEEIQWFRNKLGLPEDSLHIVEDAIALGGNEYAMGLVRKDSTILWKGAERGTLYHEAFHRVSLLTISPKERKKIYEFYRNRTGFVGSDKQVEEALAEDFRQYMLNKVDPELNLLKRAWKAIKNFISKWVWRTDTSIDNIFNRIDSGYYNRSKQDSAAVNEFLAAYKGAGAPFKIRNHKFKNITNTQFKETVNSLVGALFTLNNIRLRDDLQNLNYGVLKAALKPDITAKLVEKGTITKEQGEVRDEIYNTFDTVFKPEIINKLNEYQIRAVDKQENIDAEIDEKAVGNSVGDQMANYIQEQLSVSVKDNALASIKIFITTMPRTEFVMKQKTNPDGTVTQVQGVAAIKSPVTGLPLMVDFDKSWNTIINEIHSENTFKGMMDKSAKLAKVAPLFKTLYNELYKVTNEYVQKKGIQEDEAQKIARENLQTQFRNTFRKARHKLVGILSEKVEDENGNEQTNLYVKDENANKVSKSILEGWNYSLITNGSVLDTSDNLFKAKVSESEEFIAREINNEFNKIIKVVEKYKTTPNKKLANGQTYKEYVPEKLITIKNKIVDLLNKVGVEIDLESLNSFLTKEYYNSDPTEALVSMLSDRSNKSIYFFFNSKVKDLAKIQESGVIPGQYNRSITKYYADSKFLGRLAETYAMLHPSSDELSVLATDGKLLYPISEHNYLSDMVQRLDNDPVTVEALTKVLYNTGNNDNPNYFKGSVLLTNLYNNADAKGKIGFETLVYFKEQGSADKGRKYTEISPLEDYIAKMTFTRAGRIILPTMGDSQTYNTLYGTAINNFKNPFDVSNGEIKFDAQILKRFINYFETELDTIEFNYKNEKNLTEEQKIKNYDTGNRNGYRFRYFNGFFKLKERPILNGIEFEKDFSNFNEALDLAEDLGGNEYGTSIISQIRNNWNKFSNAEKANLMNNYLWDAFKDELNYAQELGIIKWDGNKIASVTSLALPQKALEEASSHYKKSATVSNYSENLGAAEMIGNYFANTISSVIEFEKLFIKDPAYYKNPVDKIKRLREVLSTGVTPRIDYEEGNPMADLTEVNVGTLSDNVIVSRQADQIAEYAKRSAAIRLLQEMHNMTLDEAIRTYDSSEALPQDVEDAANLIVRDKFNGYLNPKGKVNQTDATVLISPEFYKELVRRVDGWTPQVAKAFDLLNDPNADLEADMDTYAEALAVTLKPLKFMYFGDHYDVGAKRDIPIFDKMAMFPVHRIFSTGDMGKVLEVMQSRNIHMLAFDSAVKVGQRAKEVKSRIYKDKTNKEIDMDSLMSMPTHKQSLTNFRRQLITDPHHAERQMFVSQAQKAAMGNIRSAWKYTTPDGKVYSGDELINNFNGAHNAITEAGRKEIERDFGITPDKPQVSVQRFAEIMQRKALSSNMNDNVINGLDVENGETVAPISGLSDNSWIESGLISMLNKSIVDTNLPGGMFIQMSSILYNRIAVTSDVQNERKLRFANTDGTMDCVISINLLKHIIPDYDKKTFSEAKKWLIDHGIVGPNSKAIAMGYRIPAQGQASTAALKVVDLYPEQIGDTITLPDEFTSLTGSDFDIDKLFVARYNYDKNGNRIKFETKEDYTNRLREAGLDDGTIVRKVYERYNGKTDFEANSKEANENMLLDMYISVISNPLNFAEARQPLDTVTDYLKDTILKEVDTITGQGKRTSKSQLYYATPAFQSRTKAELNGGKFGIGPFALANAHQVLTQLVKLRFKPNKILRDYGISNLYGIQSNDRNKINILDWLSALINAHVDVAKDPYIIRLNVRKLTFNMTNFLIRSGKGESTFYFLPQQILKDFAIEYDKYSGFYNVDTQNKNPESLAYRTIWNTYFEKAKSLSKGKYDQLLDFLNDKGVGVKQREKMFDVNYLKKQLKKEETFDWYYNQLLIMKTYQELDPFSRSLSELTTLSQIDTKRFGNNFGLQSAFLDKWKQFMVEQQVFEDPIKVFSNTFLGKKMQDALIFPRIAFQNTMIRLTPEFENLRTLIEFYTKGYAISDDTYINNITRSMEATYKAGFFNKYLAENGIKLSSLLGGPNSISKRLDRIKSDVRSGKYPDLLSSDGSFENVLINNIFSRPKEDTTELNGPDFIAYKPNKSGDNNLENEIIRAWEELWDSDYQEIRDFAKDLALYAFYTSGDAFGKNNIFRYVPNSIREEIGYFDYIRDLERNPDDAVKDIKVFQVIKDLWWNDHVVPTIDYYVLDSSRETIEEEGRPVYRALPHEDSGFTVVNKKGVEVQIPGIIYDKKSQSIISFNQNGQPIYPPFKKVKLDRNNDPRTTFLYEYIGINEDDAPVYRLINKKGMSYRGNILIESGRNRSVLKYNNVVPKGYEIMPEEPITWVTDLTPVKASLRAKAFNQAGEFNTDMLANIQQTVKTQQAAAYQQYLDNFEYNKPQIDEQSPVQPNASTNLAEAWSQKEGWSTEYFNSKVLPKINEAWQIEYELAPDQSVPAKFKGNMTFDYGEHGRPGLKSKSTIEAVRNGERTATTRYESQGHLDYWKQAQVGDVIEWKRGNESVKVLVTKPLTKLRTSDATQQDLFASEQPSGTINIYAGTGENADLSNFAIRPFTISGDKPESSIRIGGNFQTVEGAFQAQKLVFSSMSDDEKEAVRKRLETASGSQAKSIGRKIKDLNTVSWDKASSDIMRDLLLESFSQNPEALNRLLSTGDATLTHIQDKGKWGTEFPKILMEVRELLRNQSNIKQPAITGTTKEFSLEPFINKIFPDWKSKLPNLPEELAAEFMSWSIVPGIDEWSIKDRIEKYKDFEIEEETREAIKRGDKEGIIQGIANTISYELAKDGITERDLFINLFGQSYVDKVDRYVAEIKAEVQKEKDTTKEFLDYANQFGFTDEAALLAKDLPKASEEAKKVEEEYVFTFNDGFKINLPFSLNDQQKSALYELEKFIEDDGTEITLSGYAGTGKSTIIGIFSKWLNNRIGRGNIVYTAPTHRANVITKQNNPNANVYTLSALFGFTPDTDIAMEQGSLDLRELEFRAKNQMKYEPGQLIIIDEASMVQDGLYEYIQEIVAKHNGSVIYVGDSAQLRPVKSDHISKVFTSDGVPQITLTKVERTGDNPILKEATRLRRGEGLSYQTDINDKGQGVLYTSDDAIIDKNLKQIVTSEEFNADPLHFRVLTATNAAASTYNSKIRSLRYGKFAKPFVKGDIIMGYSNKLRKPDGSYRLINSGDYIVQSVKDTNIKFKTDKGDIEFKAFNLSIRPTGGTIMDDFQLTVIDKNEPDSKLFEVVEYKDRLWKMAKEAKQNGQISKYRDLVQMAYNVDNELNITKNLEDNQGRLKIRKAIDYGYAQTVWKSQGSTYSKVLILSNEIDTFGYGKDVMQLRNELRYVAVSRAKNFVIINSEAENKKKVSMRNEIAEEDLLDDIEFEPATEEQAINASLQDSIDELTANGKQRRKECE